MSRFDVVVVGAGPAGAWAAARVAARGGRVAILDPSHPREKPCGGGLTGRALALVSGAIDTSRLASVRISGARFQHGERTAFVDLAAAPDALPLVVADRQSFDGALLDAAVRAGATHVAERATSLRRAGSAWSIGTREGSYEADWIIGADGANSFVRRRVSRPFAREDLSIAAGYFVHGRTSGDIDVAFEDAPPGYLWSFPRPDHLAVGVCAQADESKSAELLSLARTWIDRNAPPGPGAALVRYGWPIPSLGPAALAADRPGGPGWMLVGDAAGLVDPITREGIFFALQSAGLAAEALAGGGDAAVTYTAQVREEIHGELLRAARLKQRFFQPRFIDLLLRGLQRSSRIRAVMADLVAGNQTYAGLRRRLLRTFEWRLMLELFGY
jgi:geranylgeranyl diphosphate/geranylgeranyl-bacteriochlorophyllide a reductase